jgi:hypothetical protein
LRTVTGGEKSNCFEKHHAFYSIIIFPQERFAFEFNHSTLAKNQDKAEEDAVKRREREMKNYLTKWSF